LCYCVILHQQNEAKNTMSYFLKKTNLKKGVYLQIYEGFYDSERKNAVQHSYKAIGYVNELQKQGISDPIEYYQLEVDQLNKELKDKMRRDSDRQISDNSPEKYLGYFPLKAINEWLGVKKDLDLMQSTSDFQFNVYEMLSSLVYARLVHPCSKIQSYENILPNLLEPINFSLNQLYDGVEYIGLEYEKIIEIYNHYVKKRYGFDTSKIYFDCTNYYFEIDSEDDLRRKGPSKEHRNNPIVGMGLLLDANKIPLGMKIFPGNQSEKPILRDVISALKKRNNISGRTIRVADKGLNCGDNIIEAIGNNDGYIFSKSVKMLSKKDKEWVISEEGYTEIDDENQDLKYKFKEIIDDFTYTITNESGVKEEHTVHEKRIVTFSKKLAIKQQKEILKQVEKAKKYVLSNAKKADLGHKAKYISFEAIGKNGRKSKSNVLISLDEKKIEEDLELAGYNMYVTSEVDLSGENIVSTYHSLWRIEESFRVIKSVFNARPVYVQKEDTIIGHFLICYIAILLLRIFQFVILENRYCSETITGFIKSFKIVNVSDRKNINITKNSTFIKDLSKLTRLPLTSYYLNTTQINELVNYRFPIKKLLR